MFSSYITLPISRSQSSPADSPVTLTSNIAATSQPAPPPQPDGRPFIPASVRLAQPDGDVESADQVDPNHSSRIDVRTCDSHVIVAAEEGTESVTATGGSSGSTATTPAAPALSGTGGTRSATTEPPQVHMEPARQARELQMGRPRGVAVANRSTAQGLLRSGRARFRDRNDTADIPLLQEGSTAAGTQLPRTESEADTEACLNRREQVTSAGGLADVGTHQAATASALAEEESHGLMQESEVVS